MRIPANTGIAKTASSLALLLAAACTAAAAPSAATCAAISAPSPCGQSSDSAERCLSKGCCYDASKSYPCFHPGGDAVPITDVHIVQASHFDAGFAYTIKDVLELWWYSHFPRAHALGAAIAANASLAELALHFTAQCWLVDLFFACPPAVPGGLRCPTDAEQADVAESIRNGWLTWHAFPFNSEYELHGAGMLAAGVARCHALDDRFGFARKATASQRDVPGTTRSAVPHLLAAGVTAFSNGVNGASTPPFVPRAFVWRDAASGLSLPTMIHPYGYGGTGAEDAVVAPGLAHALVFAWRGDNAGPPDSVAEIAGDLAGVKAAFPGARVFFSTFDNFTASGFLDAAVLAQLPVVTSEMGDTWVHGAGSDPVRTAFFRRAGALRSLCVARGACSEGDPVLQNFTRLVLKCGEHTWGKDIKGFLHDTNHWTNAELAAQIAAGAPNFLDVIASWQEQRAWCVDYSIQSLAQAGHPLAAELQKALADLRPSSPPITAGYAAFAPGTVYNAGRWSIGFDAATGAISTLVDSATGVAWASPADGSLLALGHYVTLSQDDYSAFTGPEPAGYYPQPGDSPGWFQLDFGKPNCSEGGAAHQEVSAALAAGGGTGVWLLETPATAEFLVSTAYAPALSANFGAPHAVWMRVSVPRDATSASIALAYEIYGKTPTRLPEGLFLRFNVSQAGGPLQWRVVSLGGAVDPFDVVPGGNQHLHGFAGDRADDSGVRVQTAAGKALMLSSDSAALAAFGKPWPLPAPVFPNATDPREGMAFMLEGNTWGTNYPMWFPFDAKDSSLRWRFAITAL